MIITCRRGKRDTFVSQKSCDEKSCGVVSPSHIKTNARQFLRAKGKRIMIQLDTNAKLRRLTTWGNSSKRDDLKHKKSTWKKIERLLHNG